MVFRCTFDELVNFGGIWHLSLSTSIAWRVIYSLNDERKVLLVAKIDQRGLVSR